MPEFFQTPMGRQFYEGTMPRIARELEELREVLKEIRDELKKANGCGGQSESGSDKER